MPTRVLVLTALLAFPLAALAQTPPRTTAPRTTPPRAVAPRPDPPRPAPAAPASELVTEAGLTRDLLRGIYDAARLTTGIDAGGNLSVKVGTVSFYALLGKDHIRLLASYSFAARAAYQEKLDLANRINDTYLAVRAAIPADKPDEIHIDHYILLGAGISRATVVAITRRFAEITNEAVDVTDSDRLLK